MNQQSLEEADFNSSKFWVFRYLVLLMLKFFDHRQTEEWIGDLEEAIWIMKESELSDWQINLQILYRTFGLCKSLIISKRMVSKRKILFSHIEEDFMLSDLETDILSVMGTQKLYGLEILEGLNEIRPIPIGFGSLYPTLNQLEHKGLISCKWSDEKYQIARDRRKYYEITGAGASVLGEVQKYRQLLALSAQQYSLMLCGA